jgi:hypothetical protein
MNDSDYFSSYPPGGSYESLRLRKEPHFEHSSDGSMTGLSILMLRKTGLSNGDHIECRVKGLRATQMQLRERVIEVTNIENWQVQRSPTLRASGAFH